jgi:uncharacterized protein YcfL
MKRISILAFIFLSVVGCSTNESKQQMFIDAAQACNTICKENPSVSEVSSAGAIGLPLLLIGGAATSCQCSR